MRPSFDEIVKELTMGKVKEEVLLLPEPVIEDIESSHSKDLPETDPDATKIVEDNERDEDDPTLLQQLESAQMRITELEDLLSKTGRSLEPQDRGGAEGREDS